MDAFALRNKLVDDYSAYIKSFITIRDPRIGKVVDDELRNGLLWPDPLLQLNPSFEPGPWIDDLVASGRLHPECQSIFRIKQDGEPAKRLRLHQHQGEAVEAAASGDSYVLTTGTGSGKSMTYRVILEVYDAMQQAIDSGEPYQTRLDPPPADPSVAHTSPPPAWVIGSEPTDDL